MTFDRAKMILLRKTVSVLQGRLREGVPLIFLAFAPLVIGNVGWASQDS